MYSGMFPLLFYIHLAEEKSLGEKSGLGIFGVYSFLNTAIKVYYIYFHATKKRITC